MAVKKCCRTYKADIIESIDGCLDADRRERLESHLSVCPRCRDLARGHERIHTLVAAAKPTHALRGSVAPEVLAMARESGSQRHGAALFWAGVGATVAAAAIAVSLLWRPAGPAVQPTPGAPGTGSSVAYSQPLSVDLCAREHARASLSFAPADRAAWSLALAQSNLRIQE
ncbi:MAG: zf-HC2 domain-containing protein [Armatimonadetes bacterium]|jgi:anti-sigma factor RsiW|nr:zf-HC2 domain-containing protein [Armatimonadota bacterium]MDI9601801.1 zf-HC2 domain-containing protein [Acidobacteriota bacterium]NLN90348.1 zf-HC2 domain-containing protein [candidate division WS1 bacterium]